MLSAAQAGMAGGCPPGSQPVELTLPRVPGAAEIIGLDVMTGPVSSAGSVTILTRDGTVLASASGHGGSGAQARLSFQFALPATAADNARLSLCIAVLDPRRPDGSPGLLEVAAFLD
ncbi:hypothetical protein DFP89_103102 [Paracoccus lutimaris]|uniref:Bacterial spore germination immunoglobulin-like domain-containing protein n=2 Tax=Paracoccus lutimaris TaxID=1490030 RepID=A0A368Z5P3_9RHOB|nr:hypothetical protein DFP89_103102 [Paracoccus lutimaris]